MLGAGESQDGSVHWRLLRSVGKVGGRLLNLRGSWERLSLDGLELWVRKEKREVYSFVDWTTVS